MRLIFFTMISLISYRSKSQRVGVNFLDSNSVNKFVLNSSICNQIHAAQKFASNIVQEKGYAVKILEALSKSTGYGFFLPFASGGILLTTKQKMEAVKEQLKDLQEKQCLPK